MKRFLIAAAALGLLAGAAHSQGSMNNNAPKKNDPNLQSPSTPGSQRQGTSARQDEPGVGGTGNSSAQSGQAGGSATGGAGGGTSGNAGGTGAEGTGGGSAK